MLDGAIDDCMREHGSALYGEPSVIKRMMERNDGSEFEGTVVFVLDEDGWWDEYARVHDWPRLTQTRMRELFGEKNPQSSDSR